VKPRGYQFPMLGRHPLSRVVDPYVKTSYSPACLGSDIGTGAPGIREPGSSSVRSVTCASTVAS